MIRSSISEIESIDDICVVRISNGKKNKITEPEFIKTDELDNYLTENRCKGLIITGNERNFSDGADVSLIENSISNTEELTLKLRKGKELLYYIENLPVVTVAAITGACFGAGLEIALSCQFRISKQNSFFGLPEVNRGIVPGMSGVERLTRLTGKSRAIRIALSGEIFTSEEALNADIIDKITDEDVIDASLKFVHELTDNRNLCQIRSIVDTANNSQIINRFSDKSYFTEVLKEKEGLK